MPQVTVTEISLSDALGRLSVGHSVKKEFRDFTSYSYSNRSTITGYSSQNATVPRDTYAAYYSKRKEESYKRVFMGSVVILLVIVAVLVWFLIKKTSGKKSRHSTLQNGKETTSQTLSEPYDLKDKEIDRKDKEIERKELEVERKEKELEKEREKRKKMSSKFEAERRNFELEVDGTKDELKKLKEERAAFRKELEFLQSKHDAEMRFTREEFDSKAAEVRKRFEDQLSEFETSQKHFWPEVFQEARSLSVFCECVKESFAEGSKPAAALYAELVSQGSRLGDMQAFVNQVSPVGKALYAWLSDAGRTGDGFDLLLAQWLTEKVSSVDLKVVAVQPGEAYNNSIHDCANLNGNSVSKVMSFLILGKSNRTELKAIVEVS